jgi:regulator of protease activity HflC (stomatin/prohibitin superfamily)
MSNKSKLLIGAVLLCLILGSLFVGCERIDAGSVGLKVDAVGGDRGVSKTQYVNGWQFYLKGVTRIYEYPISQQPTEYKTSEDKPEDFIVASKGGTPFTLHPSFSFSVNPDKVDIMFQNLRVSVDQLRDGYIKQAMKAALREVSNSFTPDSMLNYVTIYDAAVTDALNHKLAPYFSVSQYTSNIIPDQSLKAALQAKAAAIQEAAALENQQKKIKVQVENDILEAKRDSAIKVMGALAEAKSIQLKQEALRQSPQYVELVKAERWDGRLSQYVFGGNTTPMIDIRGNK